MSRKRLVTRLCGGENLCSKFKCSEAVLLMLVVAGSENNSRDEE